MQVLVNSDHHITATEGLSQWVEEVVSGTLDRFADRITRVEVHLNDTNSHKLGDNDKRCMMEARLGGLKPIAVTEQAAALREAVVGAVEKLERALEHSLGRLEETAGRAPPDDQIATLDVLEDLEQRESERR
jgi:ribosome-associated translation inhibitor RaiA